MKIFLGIVLLLAVADMRNTHKPHHRGMRFKKTHMKVKKGVGVKDVKTYI